VQKELKAGLMAAPDSHDWGTAGGGSSSAAAAAGGEGGSEVAPGDVLVCDSKLKVLLKVVCVVCCVRVLCVLCVCVLVCMCVSARMACSTFAANKSHERCTRGTRKRLLCELRGQLAARSRNHTTPHHTAQELAAMRAADPSSKALVFSQYNSTLEWLKVCVCVPGLHVCVCVCVCASVGCLGVGPCMW
jgi:hypothetical protein